MIDDDEEATGKFVEDMMRHVMTNTAETGATDTTPWEAGGVTRDRFVTEGTESEGIFSLGDVNIFPAIGPGPVAIAAGLETAALIVRAVNRDSRFTDMVAALEHARARFRCLEDQFEESGDTASWAMCSVDADRMEKILASIKASTS